MQRCIEGDRRSQKRLYELLLPYLNAIVRRYLFAEAGRSDVLQETFIHVFNQLNTYNENRGTVKAWAARIAINTSINAGKKAQRQAMDSLDEQALDVPVAPTVMEQMSNQDLINHLKQMPQTWFEVFNLYAIDGYTHPEIAALLGISPALSRQRLSRARKWMADSFDRVNASPISKPHLR